VENARSLIAGIKSAMMTIPCSRKHALKEPQRNALAAGRTPQYSSYCALCMDTGTWYRRQALMRALEFVFVTEWSPELPCFAGVSRASRQCISRSKCVRASYGPGVVSAPLRHTGTGEPLLNVVFYAPSIHWNTGNTARTTVGFQARLHIIEPLGFSLSDRHLKRAGLDYWPFVDLRVWSSWQAFRDEGLPQLGNVFYFTKFAQSSLLDADLVSSKKGSEVLATKITLIFGNELDGFERIPPEDIPRERTIAIPMVCPGDAGIRSYNLSTSAAIALWEAYRQVQVALRSDGGPATVNRCAVESPRATVRPQ
jgi:tRNA (cytidine/uridine-2'-O-)-methyltransferase